MAAPDASFCPNGFGYLDEQTCNWECQCNVHMPPECEGPARAQRPTGDPQGGGDIAEVKRRVGEQVCLVGNVNCGLLQTGTEAEVVEEVRYALKHGMPNGGYVFGTSNCVYTGLPLAPLRKLRPAEPISVQRSVN